MEAVAVGVRRRGGRAAGVRCRLVVGLGRTGDQQGSCQQRAGHGGDGETPPGGGGDGHGRSLSCGGHAASVSRCRVGPVRVVYEEGQGVRDLAPACLLVRFHGGVDTAGRGLVVVVEDEPAIADLVRLYLSRDGYGVHVERDGLRGLDAVRTLRPSLVLLDVGLPGIDGLEVCRRLRAADDWTPVLFVTARDDEVDRVVGLQLGADDYVTKPFSPRELVARVAAVLRRSTGVTGGAVLVVGAVRVDPGSRQVWVEEREVVLTATEFDLLLALMRRPGQVLRREQLLADVWGEADYSGSRTVDVHVAQVRAKLGDASPIRTHRGVGYSVAVASRTA
ncbi:response regulator receiver domain protein [Aeromicrobium marinum DSM 15272]|uniref:Response regulator receiver domain protein n=1 Tax=Aeromicrobium marinum DSM 15272 TaxID=585531 RepID=E2SEV2_9ACTN|nr:response regulator receiver domain protein [Aeromicrobium marinum DSM 15272]